MHIEEIVKNLPALFSSLFVAILFIQSGLDKVLDWKGNVEWLTGHFAKTFLNGTVPVMLATITLMELATGLMAGAGIIYFLAVGTTVIMFWAGVVGAAAISALFFGQRVAKDYAGAAVLVPYFILLVILMILTGPMLRSA